MIELMNVEQLHEKLAAGEDLVLVDCRELGEWNEGHIEQAKFMPLSDFEEQAKGLEQFKDKAIVMQCRSGKRSMTACQHLLGEGFEKLYNLEGGILAWQEKQFPVVVEG
jgi:rhodanese-related sulfurtransferase